MTVITISRQHGSGGDEIATRLCELLGYRYFDKNLMTQVAAAAGLSENEVIDFSEAGYTSQNILNRLVSLLTTPPGQRTSVAQVSSWGRSADGAEIRQVEGLGASRSAAIVRGTIQAACKLGDVVIVGRGGQAALQAEPGVLHVRVQAPLALRIQRVSRTASVSEREAERLIAERDQASAAYVRRFYSVDSTDVTLYHLLVNTGKWAIETAAQVIADAAGRLEK